MSWSIWLVPSSVWLGAVWSKHGLKCCKSAPLYADVRSHLSGSPAIQPLAASEESWHRLVFISTGADYLFLLLLLLLLLFFFFTGMNWKLHSRFPGQIHLATQFTNGVKWHFQNFSLEAGFLWSKEKKNETSLPSLAETTELEVRGLSQINFWDISLHPTFVQPNQLTITCGL